VKLYVHYNVQPWVGVLTWTAERDFGLWRKVRGGVSKGFVMPGLKPRVESSRTATQ
jgi:signal peptidase complex subunit 3